MSKTSTLRLSVIVVAAVVAAVVLLLARPETARSAPELLCAPSSDACVFVGEKEWLVHVYSGVNNTDADGPRYSCTIEFQINWGDGSPIETLTLPPNSSDIVPHSYATPGLYTVAVTHKVIPPSGAECNSVDWTERYPITVEVVSPMRITQLSLHDIDNRPLRFLSTDNHPYFGGNTPIHGSITVEGSPQDELMALGLEISGGGVTARADLSPAAERVLLNQKFGSDGELSFSSQSERLFLLPASRAHLFDSHTNGEVELRVVALNQGDEQAEKTFGSVKKLVRYKLKNRYGKRNPIRGGDDWVLPTVRGHAEGLRGVIRGTLWGDFSNMNGGPFPPHGSHQEGTDVDGDYGNETGYDARDAGVADQMLRLLRNPTHGTSIQSIYVTYNERPDSRTELCEPRNGRQERDSDHSAFFEAIRSETVPARGGGTRLATGVIRPAAGHCRHFHIRFFED